MNRSLFAIFGFAVSACVTSQSVQAGDRCSKADGDIEDVCGQLIAEPSGYRLSLKYKVEIEDAQPGEPFDLIMSLRENGRQIVDESARPVEIAVPLVYPDNCDDEFVFRDRVDTQLGKCSIDCPRDLQICARVVSAHSRKVLDREDECLTFIDNRPPTIVRHEVYYEPVPPPIVHREVYREHVYCPPPPPPVVHHVEVYHERVYCPPRPWFHVGFHYSHGHRHH